MNVYLRRPLTVEYAGRRRTGQSRPVGYRINKKNPTSRFWHGATITERVGLRFCFHFHPSSFLVNTPLALSLGAPRRILKILLFTIGLLGTLSLLGQFSHFILGHGRLFGFVPEFNVNNENNIPTYFSALLLLSAGGLLGLIARLVREIEGPFRRHWLGLAFVFAYLSIDEISSLHERVGAPLRESLGTSGVLHYAWVIPGIALLLLFAVVYLRFFLHLPARWKGLFALSGLLYVTGGLGLELAGGWYDSHFGYESFTYSVLTTIEEMLEMSGAAVFIYTLLSYLRAHVPALHVSLGTERDRGAAASAFGARGTKRQTDRA